MSRKVKFSKEVKIRVYKGYQNGNGSFRSIAKSIGIDHVVICRYITSDGKCIDNGPLVS